ncbi:MAG: ROK family protein [Chloroflexota bacterium]|nr:ROK family protein [Chloroflexota bacterium]
MTIYGGIEAGGTKFVCALGDEGGKINQITKFPTTRPEETIERAVAFFQQQPAPVTALGIGCFGPVDPDPTSVTFGHITNTPKPGWQNVNIVGQIRSALEVPIGFDTDVNAAALGEYRWGAAQGLRTFIYLTIGTGIGGGAMVEGNLLHGIMHPEMGHVQLPRLKEDHFDGTCPFHRNCLEGFAAGPAIEERWGTRGENLPPDHPAWEMEAAYIAQALVNYILILMPQRIILGGGVMHQTHLFPAIRTNVQSLLNDYVQVPQILEDIDAYIVPPGLGDQAGIKGAIALAILAGGVGKWE